MADPDCYDLVSRNEIKPSTTTDSTSTVGESDTGQDHKYNLHKEISIYGQVLNIFGFLKILVKVNRYFINCLSIHLCIYGEVLTKQCPHFSIFT